MMGAAGDLIAEGWEKGWKKGKTKGIIETARKYGAADKEIVKDLMAMLQISKKKAIKLLAGKKS